MWCARQMLAGGALGTGCWGSRDRLLGLGDRLLGVGGSLVGWLRGNEPTRAEEARGEVELSRYARWGWVIASKARFGSLPLLPRLGRGRLEGQAAGDGDRLLWVCGGFC